jgi:hypothetical protein
MQNNFTSQFENNLEFSYTSFDRITISGWILNLFFEGQLVKYLKAAGYHSKSQAVLEQHTHQFLSHVDKLKKTLNIPEHWVPSLNIPNNGGKQAFVEKTYVSKYTGDDNHVYCILSDKENVLSFTSREKTSQSGRQYHKIYKGHKPCKQLYFYLHDKVLGGPCYLKISSWLPFACEFNFNGHNYVRHQLDKRGIGYKMNDNCFTQVDDPHALEQIAQELDGRVVLERIEYWMNILFRFNKGEQSRISKYLKHSWYCSQIEICSNFKFKSAKFCSNLFERLLDKHSRMGAPDSIMRIFEVKGKLYDTKSTIKKYNGLACIKHWFRSNSVKSYNKCGNLIRIETTINNPKTLKNKKLEKKLLFLTSYFWYGQECNNRMANSFAMVDIGSIADENIEKYTQTVINASGKKIAAPDLRKDRQKALCKELSQARYNINGFSNKELGQVLKKHFDKTAKVRHEIAKLKERGIIEKKQNSNYYKVTNFGVKWLWITNCTNEHFSNPLLSMISKKDIRNFNLQPSKIEDAYRGINANLNNLISELYMKK